MIVCTAQGFVHFVGPRAGAAAWLFAFVPIGFIIVSRFHYLLDVRIRMEEARAEYAGADASHRFSLPSILCCPSCVQISHTPIHCDFLLRHHSLHAHSSSPFAAQPCRELHACMLPCPVPSHVPLVSNHTIQGSCAPSAAINPTNSALTLSRCSLGPGRPQGREMVVRVAYLDYSFHLFTDPNNSSVVRSMFAFDSPQPRDGPPPHGPAYAVFDGLSPRQ